MTTPFQDDEDYLNAAAHSDASSYSIGRAELHLLPASFLPAMSSPTSTPRPRRRHKSLSSKGGMDLFGCPLTPQAAMLQPGVADPVTPPPPLFSESPHAHMHWSPKSPCNFTPEQQAKIDSTREKVRAMETAIQEAAAKSLPTDELIQATEEKRRELQELMIKFRTENAPLGLLHSRRMSEPTINAIVKQAPTF